MRKQATQLPSKMRFVAAQFDALFADDLWIRNAAHANAMARRLAAATHDIPGVTLAREPAVNSVFVRLPADAIPKLQAESFFWTWDETVDEVRCMTSFDTTEADIEQFAATVRRVLA